jgi:predicted transcriptional regulator of viral defense system
MRLGGAVDRLRRRWNAADDDPRSGSAADKLLQALPDHLILDVAAVETIAQVSNEAARLAVNQLETAGVLERINAGSRIVPGRPSGSSKS